MKFKPNPTLGEIELSAEEVAEIVGRHVEANHPEGKGRIVVIDPRDFQPARVRIDARKKP